MINLISKDTYKFCLNYHASLEDLKVQRDSTNEKQTHFCSNLLMLRMRYDESRRRPSTSRTLLSRPTSVCSQSSLESASKRHRLIIFTQTQFYSTMISHYVIMRLLSGSVFQQIHNQVKKVDCRVQHHMGLVKVKLLHCTHDLAIKFFVAYNRKD